MRIPSVSLIAKDQLPAVVPAGVTAFNSNDASGAAGLAADVGAIASVGAHALPVLTGAYTRDTAEIFDHFTLDEEGVTEQARTVLEDLPVQAFKVGFVGSPENIGVVAAIAADYSVLRCASGCVYARPLLVGRSPDRTLLGSFQGIDRAPDHSVGRKPQYLVALATSRVGDTAPSERAAWLVVFDRAWGMSCRIGWFGRQQQTIPTQRPFKPVLPPPLLQLTPQP